MPASGDGPSVQDDFLDGAGGSSALGAERATDDPAFVVDVDGFEGPLDLLLSLSRNQKVDLTRISILALVEQYLRFVAEARRLRLELAADYLVMAAWLAYLKSRLLIPETRNDDEPTGEELAAALAFRLRRLEAMREASARLLARNRLGRDVFARGMPETVSIERVGHYKASLYDLLSAYASQRQRQSVTSVHVRRRTVWSLQEARDLLVRLIGQTLDWTPIDSYLLRYIADPGQRSTVLASSFSASLELVREGEIELRQSGPFERLYLRKRSGEENAQQAEGPPGDGEQTNRDE
ncbi:segregation/condensation protein A [Rhizobiales bacterium]|uniref:segregation and condensation protein A n=1 Tax=Hongsoonwoonella zoysiae TaxID=2821844 RepID=UPI00156141CB|nr:ScpA family protein [Hongsoonwoonella zoysiae]NRG18871.1 segregation/condensation protein A [Hongsoonwoonella zoysiae]